MNLNDFMQDLKVLVDLARGTPEEDDYWETIETAKKLIKLAKAAKADYLINLTTRREMGLAVEDVFGED